MKLLIEDWYGIRKGKHKDYIITINPGDYICLIGPNGSGKTTAIEQIKKYCDDNDIMYKKFNNLKDGGGNSVSKAMYCGNTELAASLLVSSEGQAIYTNIGQTIRKLGEMTRQQFDKPIIKLTDDSLSIHQYNKDFLILLLDAVDSGLDIANIHDLTSTIVEQIIPDCNRTTVIQACNSYAMTKYCNKVIDVRTGEDVRDKIHCYEDYEKIIMKGKK